jgi:hypothetical protein
VGKDALTRMGRLNPSLMSGLRIAMLEISQEHVDYNKDNDSANATTT